MALSTTDEGVSFGYETITVFRAAGLAKTAAIKAKRTVMKRRMVLKLNLVQIVSESVKSLNCEEEVVARSVGNTALIQLEVW